MLSNAKPSCSSRTALPGAARLSARARPGTGGGDPLLSLVPATLVLTRTPIPWSPTRLGPRRDQCLRVATTPMAQPPPGAPSAASPLFRRGPQLLATAMSPHCADSSRPLVPLCSTAPDAETTPPSAPRKGCRWGPEVSPGWGRHLSPHFPPSCCLSGKATGGAGEEAWGGGAVTCHAHGLNGLDSARGDGSHRTEPMGVCVLETSLRGT